MSVVNYHAKLASKDSPADPTTTAFVYDDYRWSFPFPGVVRVVLISPKLDSVIPGL